MIYGSQIASHTPRCPHAHRCPFIFRPEPTGGLLWRLAPRRGERHEAPGRRPSGLELRPHRQGGGETHREEASSSICGASARTAEREPMYGAATGAKVGTEAATKDSIGTRELDSRSRGPPRQGQSFYYRERSNRIVTASGNSAHTALRPSGTARESPIATVANGNARRKTTAPPSLSPYRTPGNTRSIRSLDARWSLATWRRESQATTVAVPTVRGPVTWPVTVTDTHGSRDTDAVDLSLENEIQGHGAQGVRCRMAITLVDYGTPSLVRRPAPAASLLPAPVAHGYPPAP